MVEVQVVIGTVHTVLVEADSTGAAEDVVMQWDPNGDYPAAFVAVASAEEGRAVISAEAYTDGDAEEWADDNYGELVNLLTSCIECQELVIPIDPEGMAPDTCGDCVKYLTRTTDAD